MTDTVHDVIIVGSGPCGLAVASRLCEPTPSALFTDDEHQRHYWLKKNSDKTSIKNHVTGKVRPPGRAESLTCKYSTLVLDGSGQWLGNWNRLFKTFEISHLRSPMFFHVDPSDRDALVAYAKEHGREDELTEIRNCVGREVSKHHRKKQTRHGSSARHAPGATVNERDRQDYFCPSRELFKSHCDCIVERYGLHHGIVKQEQVLDLQFKYFDHVDSTRKLFKVMTSRDTHYARTLVLAVGPGSVPRPPKGTQEGRGQCHSSHIDTFPDPSVRTKLSRGRPVHIMVVGGGLTSAQLADLAVRKGATKVYHLMRGSYKVKPFDVDLEWVGKFRNFEHARFWNADSDGERLQQIKAARGGGSITPAFQTILRQHVATGRLATLTHTEITGKTYDCQEQNWCVTTEPPIPDLPRIDYIYYATGVQSDYRKLDLLQSMLADYPIDGRGGLPCLTDDLRWTDNVPLYVVGRLAALRLGPGAANLAGARAGAERIAWDLEQELAGFVDGVSNMSQGVSWTGVQNNRYLGLSQEDEEESVEV